MRNSPFLVAHRAGNDLAALARAEAAGADLIELDVHLRRGLLEVRHLKALGPLPLLWDRWEVRRRSTPLLLADVFRAAQRETELLLDLKGFDPRMAGAVSRAVAGREHAAPLAICSRDWRTVDRVEGDGIRRIYSAGSSLQLAALRRRLRRRAAPDGVSVRRSLLDARVVRELRAAVPLVLTWPVATLRDADLLTRLGVNGLICGDLPLLPASRPESGRTALVAGA